MLSKYCKDFKDADGKEHIAQVGKDREKGMRPLKPEEIQLLLTKGWEKSGDRKRLRMRAMCAFMGSGGARIGSVVALKVDDVFDVESQSFYLQVILVNTKGSRENRKKRKAQQAEKEEKKAKRAKIKAADDDE